MPVRIHVGLLLAVLSACAGCVDQVVRPEAVPLMGDTPDVRTPIRLPAEDTRAHRDVMMQHPKQSKCWWARWPTAITIWLGA